MTSIQDLRVDYDNLCAVKDFSLSVATVEVEGPSQVICVLSPVTGIASRQIQRAEEAPISWPWPAPPSRPACFSRFLNSLVTAARWRVRRAVMIATERHGDAAKVGA